MEPVKRSYQWMILNCRILKAEQEMEKLESKPSKSRVTKTLKPNLKSKFGQSV